MNRKALLLTTMAASLLVGTSATVTLAQQGPGNGPRGPSAGMFVRMLQQFDTDKNGQVSKDEAKAGEEKMFSEIDGDSDGALTPGELRKHREAKMAEWRETAKAEGAPGAGRGPMDGKGMGNGPKDGSGPMRGQGMMDDDQQDEADVADGQLPRDGDGNRFGMRGHDGDGRGWRDQDWGRGERRHGHDMAGREDGRGWGRHGRHGMRGDDHGSGMGRGPGGTRMMIRAADTDENGQISKEEAAAMMDKIFTRMDTDGNGSISVDDLPKRPLWFRG